MCKMTEQQANTSGWAEEGTPEAIGQEIRGDIWAALYEHYDNDIACGPAFDGLEEVVTKWAEKPSILPHTQPAPPASHNEIAARTSENMLNCIAWENATNEAGLKQCLDAGAKYVLSAITEAVAVLQQKYTEAIEGLAESGRLLLAEKAKADKLVEAFQALFDRTLPIKGAHGSQYCGWCLKQQSLELKYFVHEDDCTYGLAETAIAEHQKGGGDGD